MIVKADRYIRLSTMLTVICIATFAAIISYEHIYDVSHTHGQTSLDARLLPLSVDGLILAASLTAFYASRNRLSVPFLARFALVLGIGATIAVNMIYGVKYGPLGAALSAWPAVSFIVAVELSIWVVRVAATSRVGARTVAAKRDATSSHVRDWARAKGISVNDRGRLPVSVHEAYEADGGSSDLELSDYANSELVPASMNGDGNSVSSNG